MMSMILSRWRNIGPEWKTEDIFRIREILKEEHIPFRMHFSDVFFVNLFHTPAEDKRWGILVREKDLAKAAALLVREDLACGSLRQIAAEGRREAKERTLSPACFPSAV